MIYWWNNWTIGQETRAPVLIKWNCRAKWTSRYQIAMLFFFFFVYYEQNSLSPASSQLSATIKQYM